jgi:hypothetical protein
MTRADALNDGKILEEAFGKRKNLAARRGKVLREDIFANQDSQATCIMRIPGSKKRSTGSPG